jgi:hypothetical protein
VRVDDGADDVRRAAELLQGAPADAIVRLEGWSEAELRAPAPGDPAAKPRLRWVTRSRAMQVLATYVRAADVFRGCVTKLPHAGAGGALCPLDVACDECQAFSNAAYAAVHVDVRAVLRAALRDGWDVSALYGTDVMQELAEALADNFRVTYLRPPVCAETSAEPSWKRRRADTDDY